MDLHEFTEILNRNLDNNEKFELMKNHTILGSEILADSKAPCLLLARQIAISHHEKWNGEGYPYEIKGERIPVVGRIVALADVFDALTSKRPYKDPYPVDVACSLIKKESGRHFDPNVVNVFLKNIDRIVEIKKEINSMKHDTLKGFSYSDRDIV